MFRHLRIVTRHLIIVGIAVIGMVAIGGFAISEFYRHAVDERQNEIRNTVQVASSLLAHFVEMEKSGAITGEEARRQALETMRSLHYGDNYFWVFDNEPRMLMHPHWPQLENKYVGDLVDVEGSAFLKNALQTVQRDGQGYITYYWPAPGTDVPVPKLSYVAAFPDWGWIIGSGIYIGDVRRLFWQKALVVAAVGAGIALLASSLAFGLSLGVARPIEDIRRRMLRLAQGDREIDVPHLERMDEIGDLARAMDMYRAALARMQRLREERERIRAEGEQALRQSEARFKELAELLPEIVFETDLAGRLTFANSMAFDLTGYSREDMDQGFHALALIAPEDYERAGEMIARALKGDLSGPNEYTAVTKDGRRWPVMIRSTPIRRGDETVGLRGIIVDVSELKQTEDELRRARDALQQRTKELEAEVTVRRSAEEQLRLANQEAELASRAKSEFLASMSHELRTPLNSIIGFSDILKGEMFGPHSAGRYREYAEDINISGQHLLALINDILDLSAIESGRFPLREGKVDLAAVVASCMRLIRERATRASVRLQTALPDRIPVLLADERRVRQILLNLLSNAVKFTPAGGTVTLRVRRDEDGSCCLAVSDTGIGIAPQDIELVLTPFGRVSNPTVTSQEGSGLGLSLSRRLAEMHGGSLAIESTPGEGTTVQVRFPADRVLDSVASRRVPV